MLIDLMQAVWRGRGDRKMAGQMADQMVCQAVSQMAGCRMGVFLHDCTAEKP
jgi:hypothetical protein